MTTKISVFQTQQDGCAHRLIAVEKVCTKSVQAKARQKF